jgi:UDP-N-acetylglucosamine 1-carboxyvinyltransferase
MNTKDSFTIEGLAGKKSLYGSIRINGAKNAALKAMAAAVLFDSPVSLQNVPDTDDIHTTAAILKKLGAKIAFKSDHTFTVLIDASAVTNTVIDPALAATMRASVVLTGPLLGRFGKVTFPAPGGCVIGARPIDLFLGGYKKMGATVRLDEKQCLYAIEAPEGLKGAEITFNRISVGATETLMMAATLAHGKTVLENCAREPEIANVAEWLNSCGANISGVGTTTIEIQGTGARPLHDGTKPYVAIPDRIETGSYMILGALCAKGLTITDCRPDHVSAVTSLLKDSGADIETGSDWIKVSNGSPMATFKPFNVKTQEYPGFPTDLQSPIAVYLTQSQGESRIFETIFEGRFKYVEDLIKMGADITFMNPHEILIKGPAALKQLPDDEELNAHDIRAGFAIVLAALIGKGKFIVNNVQLVDRGYEKLEKKLKKIGASIERTVR